MTNDTKAPARLWASYIRTQDGRWIGKHAAQDAPYKGATQYTRHDLHLSLVAAAYEDAADKVHEECWTDGYQDNVTSELLAEQATTSLAIRAIRSNTPTETQAALDARDKRIREEALREAAEKVDSLRSDAPTSPAMQHGDRCSKAILTLIEKDKTDE